MIVVTTKDGTEQIEADAFNLDTAGNLLLLETLKLSARPGEARIIRAYSQGNWCSVYVDNKGARDGESPKTGGVVKKPALVLVGEN